jgi:hypothetical protein
MSDIIPIVKKDVNGFMSFMQKIWAGIKRIFSEIWSIISDVEKNADPWKIAGMIVIGISIYGAIFIFGHIDQPVEKLGILSGLVSAGLTLAGFLFNQSVKSDQNLINKK